MSAPFMGRCASSSHEVSGETFRVTKEELQNSGVWYEDALELEDGDYQGGLGMMHELHCLVCEKLLVLTIGAAYAYFGLSICAAGMVASIVWFSEHVCLRKRRTRDWTSW